MALTQIKNGRKTQLLSFLEKKKKETICCFLLIKLKAKCNYGFGGVSSFTFLSCLIILDGWWESHQPLHEFYTQAGAAFTLNV